MPVPAQERASMTRVSSNFNIVIPDDAGHQVPIVDFMRRFERIVRNVGRFGTTDSAKTLTVVISLKQTPGTCYWSKNSEYGKQLIEKQKLRETYGVSERQFQKLFLKAKSTKGVVTGVYFMQLLESRLDNVVYRLGFAATRRQARQLVNHGHVTVNGSKVDIPSYLVAVGSEISLKDNSKNLLQKCLMFVNNQYRLLKNENLQCNL